jgi:hypothetical protein
MPFGRQLALLYVAQHVTGIKNDFNSAHRSDLVMLQNAVFSVSSTCDSLEMLALVWQSIVLFFFPPTIVRRPFKHRIQRKVLVIHSGKCGVAIGNNHVTWSYRPTKLQVTNLQFLINLISIYKRLKEISQHFLDMHALFIYPPPPPILERN